LTSELTLGVIDTQEPFPVAWQIVIRVAGAASMLLGDETMKVERPTAIAAVSRRAVVFRRRSCRSKWISRIALGQG
jgi:hypothetical protein